MDVPSVTSDFLPTLRDYLGLVGETPDPLDGISLRPLLERTATQRPAPISMGAALDAWRLSCQQSFARQRE